MVTPPKTALSLELAGYPASAWRRCTRPATDPPSPEGRGGLKKPKILPNEAGGPLPSDMPAHQPIVSA